MAVRASVTASSAVSKEGTEAVLQADSKTTIKILMKIASVFFIVISFR